MKEETNRMNTLLAAGHIDTKGQFAAKPEEITQISKRIEELAREIQAIYDNRDYLQYCMVFEEEGKYKEHNNTDLKLAVSKLNIIAGINS